MEQARSLIYFNVSTVLQTGLLKNQPLTQWIDYLRAEAEPSDGFMLIKMKNEYRTILRSFQSSKNLATWLDTWETFMVKASRYNLPDLDGGNWLLDLSILVDQVHQTYATQFREAAKSIQKDKKELNERNCSTYQALRDYTN